MRSRWQVGLAGQARRDFSNILSWTAEQFGKRQARAYDNTLRGALRALADGPGGVGYRTREDIGPGIMSLHVARKGRKGRHFILLRADAAAGIIEVLRILHDSMDLARHVEM